MRAVRAPVNSHGPGRLPTVHVAECVAFNARKLKTPVLEGSGSRRLYPPKSIYVVFGARVHLGFFTICQKRICDGSTYAEHNSGSLKQQMILARLHHCLTAMPGKARHNRPSAAGQTTHTVCIDLNGGRHAGREEAGKEQGRMEGGREGSRGGIEGGSDDARQGESVSGGRES